MRAFLPFLAVALMTFGGFWVSRPPSTPAAPSEPIPWKPPLNRMQETGRRIYLHRCAWCHGKERDGFGLNATKLEIAPADFTAPQFRSTHSKAVLIDWLEGRRVRLAPFCPSWQETLAPAERDAVTDYLLGSVD
ncbi:MAG: hypothetical protein HY236_12130 [Acidobacteria bacterium]|nr:hypothetical protein [Acidobacteriota bacterium]